MSRIEQPPLFTEYCTCGCRAIDHSLMWWLGDLLRLPDQRIIGRCGKCAGCISFSYDGPAHESKLISYRDYLNAPTVADSEGVRLAAAKIKVSNVEVHDHPLSISEIMARVDAELHPHPILNPQEAATAQANRSGYIPGRTSVEVKFPTIDVSRRLRFSNIKIHNRVLSNEEIAQRVADLVLECLDKTRPA